MFFLFYILYFIFFNFYSSRIQDQEADTLALETYRALNILSTMYNNGFCSTLYATLKTCLEGCAFFCLYCTIRFHHVAEFWVYMLFPLASPFILGQLVSTIS